MQYSFLTKQVPVTGLPLAVLQTVHAQTCHMSCRKSDVITLAQNALDTYMQWLCMTSNIDETKPVSWTFETGSSEICTIIQVYHSFQQYKVGEELSCRNHNRGEFRDTEAEPDLVHQVFLSSPHEGLVLTQHKCKNSHEWNA